MIEELIDYAPAVAAARKSGRPLVALESTIITHGMPYPENVATALRVEEIVRQAGAEPATMALIDGRIKVGLSASQIEALAQAKGVIKTSRRDLPFILAQKRSGATTVAATMILADLAGIKVFVTGGIGGVHRGAETTFDISADLLELAQTDVAVVCAGVKSILDIGLTLEYLETHGVPVVGYQTEDLPAFYTRSSGFPVDYRCESTKEIAAAMAAKWAMGLKGGLVVANPIPAAHELDPALFSRVLNEALAAAAHANARGKDITPFLLAKIKDLSGGSSLHANKELVYNNARVGAQLALDFAQISSPSFRS